MSLAHGYRLLAADVYELAGASRRAGERIAAAEGITVPRWHVLSVVSEAPTAVPAIADRLGLRRQSVQPVADELVGSGLAGWRDNPAHRRSPLLAITPAGSATLDTVVAVADRERGAQLRAAGITEERLAEARAVLRDVLRALA